jgi:hypothetical protein
MKEIILEISYAMTIKRMPMKTKDGIDPAPTKNCFHMLYIWKITIYSLHFGDVLHKQKNSYM